MLSDETAAQITEVEYRVKLMETLGSVAGTQNIDRILRLPGTVNLPNAKKLREGRTACPTKLIKFNGATCRVEDFPPAAAAPPPSNGTRARALPMTTQIPATPVPTPTQAQLPAMPTPAPNPAVSTGIRSINMPVG